MEPRRFPPPWTVEETDACFIVKDRAGLSLAQFRHMMRLLIFFGFRFYFEDKPGRQAAARLLSVQNERGTS
jgi:hypothetical protein